ncbi:MAG: hypothetical protein AAGA55_11315, partial [Planctomycetota bacterium]
MPAAADPHVAQVVDALRAGAQANLDAACRLGSIDRVQGPGRLVATGDIHDNPDHFDRVIAAAGLDTRQPAHITLHELIHPPGLK